MDELTDVLWRFIRREMTAEDFEQWVYARATCELPCECPMFPGTVAIDMAHPGRALAPFRAIRRRGEPYWWLGVTRCAACNTPWLMAAEERQNDVFVLRRLSETQLGQIEACDSWPADFDEYETVVRLGSVVWRHRAPDDRCESA